MLLDLPLEIFRLIIQQVINSGTSHDLAQVKLISKLFSHEIIDQVCSTIDYDYNGRCRIFAAYYIQRRALAPNSSEDNAFIRTVRDVSYCIWQMMDDLNHDTDLTESDRHEKLKQTTLEVSRAAVELNLLRLDVALGENDPEYHDSYEYDQDWEHLLPVAVNLGNLPLVEYLMETQEYIGLETCSSIMFRTPLFNAAYKGDLEIAHALLNGGADVGIDVELRDEDMEGDGLYESFVNLEPMEFPTPKTALEAAVLGGHEQILRLLLSHPHSNVSRRSYGYYRAMICAAIKGNLDLLKSLHQEADFTPITKNEIETLWSQMLLCAAGNGNNKVIPYLLDMGAQLEYSKRTPLRCEMFATALGFAASRGQNDTIQLLLEKGADLDARWSGDPHGPIHLAAAYGFPRTVELLLDKGAFMPPLEPWSLAQAVAEYDAQIEVLRILLERGVHKRHEDAGKAALDAAVVSERQDVVTLLKEYGVTSDGKWLPLATSLFL